MLLGEAFEQRGEADAAADDLQEALACSSLLAPLMPARARLMASHSHIALFHRTVALEMQRREAHRAQPAIVRGYSSQPENGHAAVESTKNNFCSTDTPITIGSALLECAWALIKLTGAHALPIAMRMVCSQGSGGIENVGHSEEVRVQLLVQSRCERIRALCRHQIILEDLSGGSIEISFVCDGCTTGSGPPGRHARPGLQHGPKLQHTCPAGAS